MTGPVPVVPGDPAVEAAVRYDFEHNSYLHVYGSYEAWRTQNPEAFEHCMDDMRFLLAVALPHLREQAAAEIEALQSNVPDDGTDLAAAYLRGFGVCRFQAARVVRGDDNG